MHPKLSLRSVGLTCPLAIGKCTRIHSTHACISVFVYTFVWPCLLLNCTSIHASMRKFLHFVYQISEQRSDESRRLSPWTVVPTIRIYTELPIKIPELSGTPVFDRSRIALTYRCENAYETLARLKKLGKCAATVVVAVAVNIVTTKQPRRNQ